MASRILGIDYGSKFVGLALAGTQTRVASAYDYLDTDGSIKRLLHIIELEQVEKIVVGLPRSSTGEETRQSLETRDWVKKLEDKIDIPVIMIDEFGTTALARDRLREAGHDMSNAKESGAIDMQSAALILEDFLNS